MRARREPFFGMPEDAHLLPEPAPGALDTEYEKALSAETDRRIEHFVAGCEMHRMPARERHPDFVEKGVELPLGFHQHDGENRKTRRAAVANWVPPVIEKKASNQAVESAPTRRELWLQRQRQRRGKLDPELRRMQRKAISNG